MLYQIKHGPYYARKNKSFDYTIHAHHALELLVCTDGTCKASCNFRTEVLRPGDVMIAFPNDIHSYMATGDGTGITIIADLSLLSHLAARLEKNSYTNFLLTRDPDLICYAEAFCKEYNAQKDESILLGWLYLLLGTLLKQLPMKENRNELDASRFSAVLRYVSGHYTQKLTLRSLSEQFGISTGHLSRTFSGKLSCSFLHYLHILRVEHAKNLLQHSSLPILQIAFDSGFSDQRTFNRVFLSQVGVSPKTFRLQNSG